jgi:hypothetical protein
MESTTIKQNIFESLSGIVLSNRNGIREQAKYELESLFAFCREGMETDSQKFLATILIKALNKNIHSETINENIYQKQYEVSQIQLFNILIDKFPYVKYSQQIINTAIVELIKKNDTVTIIDIGVGLGTQMANIIEMSKHLNHLKKLVIIGIEPFAEALSKAEERINAYHGKVPFEIEFVAVQDYAEHVNYNTLSRVQGTIIVNASLALHHIQSDAQRFETISKIKSISPAAFILTEPNVNHFEPDLYKRFQNCYNHFYSLFQVIDQLEIDNNEKNALKLFFGREIEDILGKPEQDRFEKHEPATHWISRLKENQFNINNELLRLPNGLQTGVEIKYHNEGFLGFTFDKETALAVIYAN